MFDDNRQILLVQTHNRCWHPSGGSWRFVIQAADGQISLDASDIEPGVTGERLDLLTVVRGLEALEQESSVTLITDQRYVIRGMRYGLDEWREHNWKWSRFGDLVDINHADLWQRLDHALSFHQIQCRQFRVDPAHSLQRHVPKPHFARRRRGRILTTEDAGELLVPESVEQPLRGLDPNWMTAATTLGIELAQRWELQAS
jgi:ribonuclease HI